MPTPPRRCPLPPRSLLSPPPRPRPRPPPKTRARAPKPPLPPGPPSPPPPLPPPPRPPPQPPPQLPPPRPPDPPPRELEADFMARPGHPGGRLAVIIYKVSQITGGGCQGLPVAWSRCRESQVVLDGGPNVGHRRQRMLLARLPTAGDRGKVRGGREDLYRSAGIPGAALRRSDWRDCITPASATLQPRKPPF